MTSEHARERPLMGNYCVRGGTRSPLVVVRPRIGDLSPVQANTKRAGRTRNPQAESLPPLQAKTTGVLAGISQR